MVAEDPGQGGDHGSLSTGAAKGPEGIKGWSPRTRVRYTVSGTGSLSTGAAKPINQCLVD